MSEHIWIPIFNSLEVLLDRLSLTLKAIYFEASHWPLAHCPQHPPSSPPPLDPTCGPDSRIVPVLSLKNKELFQSGRMGRPREGGVQLVDCPCVEGMCSKFKPNLRVYFFDTMLLSDKKKAGKTISRN